MEGNKKTKGTTGAVFTSHHVFFCELTLRGEELLPTSYGHVTIPYDVLVNGVIKDKIALIEVFKKMYRQTHTNTLVLESTGSTKTDSELKEIFAVAGYKQVTTNPSYKHLKQIAYLSTGVAFEGLVLLGRENSASLIDLGNANTVVVEFTAEDIANTIEFTETINTHLLKQDTQELLLAGMFPQNFEELKVTLDTGGIAYQAPNVWHRAFSFDSYVPSMDFAQSISFAQCVALALESEKPNSDDEQKEEKAVEPEPEPKSEVEITEILAPISRTMGIAESMGEIKPLSKSPEDHEETQVPGPSGESKPTVSVQEPNDRSHKTFRVTRPLLPSKL